MKAMRTYGHPAKNEDGLGKTSGKHAMGSRNLRDR